MTQSCQTAGEPRGLMGGALSDAEAPVVTGEADARLTVQANGEKSGATKWFSQILRRHEEIRAETPAPQKSGFLRQTNLVARTVLSARWCCRASAAWHARLNSRSPVKSRPCRRT